MRPATSKLLKVTLLKVTLFIFGVLIVNLVLNLYTHHNVTERGVDGKIKVSKIDGIFGYTEIEKKGKTIEVNEFGEFLSYRYYEDKNGDGKVDMIHISESIGCQNNKDMFLYRNKHYNEFKSEFDKADEDLKKQLVRFKDKLRR